MDRMSELSCDRSQDTVTPGACGWNVASVVLVINAHHTAGKQLERLADVVRW